MNVLSLADVKLLPEPSSMPSGGGITHNRTSQQQSSVPKTSVKMMRRPTHRDSGGESSEHTLAKRSAKRQGTLDKNAESALSKKEFHSLSGATRTISAGLVIVGIADPSQFSNVRNTFTDLAEGCSSRLDLAMPNTPKILSLFAGHPSRMESAELLASFNRSRMKVEDHTYKSIGNYGNVDWGGREGYCLLQPFIQGHQGMLMLEQEVFVSISATNAEVFTRIRIAAQQSGVAVMLFIACPVPCCKSKLNHYCDEYIQVNSCEPDFGFDSAFSIDFDSLRHLNCVGIGKTMCNVKFENGAFKRRYSPFISSQLEDRVIWTLRAAGKTLDEIAKIVKKHKSTVLRRLQAMLPVRQIKGGDELIAHYLDARPTIGDGSDVVRDNDVIRLRDKNDV